MRNRQQAARYAHLIRLVLGFTPSFYLGSSSESAWISAEGRIRALWRTR